ncbi:MAG TPA: SAM-dependent methyltransferase [Candidatus Limnocylindrales bacterium]|nr:SAM-dependent methyltransferase [Candidatus Limnocylindrales bacterium]
MDLKRLPPLPGDVPSDPQLLAAIRAEIERDGPMTFARFMTIALYDPERGYYRGPVPRPGRGGDFLTAPEASPVFGRTVAAFAAAVHDRLGRPPTLTIREHGAGTGALASPLVGELLARDGGPRTIRYLVAEVEPRRVEAVAARLAMDRFDPERVIVEEDRGDPIDGLVIANEVLDALPTQCVVGRGGALREILVGLDDDGELMDVEAEPTTPALAARLDDEGVALADGQRAEICLALDDWVRDAAEALQRGVLLIIDYGYPAAELYDPRRRAAGTLATYLGHTVGDDPYRAIGRQDLTAHVDLSALERAASGAGLDLLGSTTQTDFLARLGIGEQLVAEQTRPGASLPAYLETRSAVIRMIDPGAMGRFRVVAFGRGLAAEPPLAGLAATAGSH